MIAIDVEASGVSPEKCSLLSVGAVDYDFASRKEIVKVVEKWVEKDVWTGDYIFDNEWQSFRTKKNRTLELVSATKAVPKGIYKVAVKVVDIFGNDTTKVIEVKI